MRKQWLPAIRSVANTHRHARERSDQSGFERIRKKNRKVEIALAPLAYLLDHGTQAAAIMNLQSVNKLGAREQTFGPGTGGERNVGLGKKPANFTQGRDSHYRVADPVGAANHDPLDGF